MSDPTHSSGAELSEEAALRTGVDEDTVTQRIRATPDYFELSEAVEKTFAVDELNTTRVRHPQPDPSLFELSDQVDHHHSDGDS